MGFITHSKSDECPEKYFDLRKEIKNGDLILYAGTSFMAKSIMYFDKAYYNHIGVVWRPEENERVLTVDMWTKGIDCVPLSRRMAGYKDFCILRPKTSSENIKSAISLLMDEWDGREIKYNYWILLRLALIKKTGIDLSGLGSNSSKFICSQFAQYYCDVLGFKTYNMVNLITPEDFRRFIDENFELLYDEAPKVDMSFEDKKIWHLGGKNYKLL